MGRKRKASMRWISQNVLHIETELGIINIRLGLRDRLGRKVEGVEIIPDKHSGEPRVKVSGSKRTRLIQLKSKKNR